MSEAASRSVRTIVSHWAHNMTLMHNLGISYPGFGYTEEEKQQLGALAKGVSSLGHLGFGFLNAVYFCALAGFVMGYGAIPLAFLLDPTHQSAGVFFGCMGLGIAIGIGFGVPASMGLTALTFRLFGKEPQAPDVSDDTVAALYRKMYRQLLRAGVVTGVLIGPWVLFGMTKTGGHLIEFLTRVVVTLAPFAFLLLVLTAFLRGTKRY